MVQTRNPIMTVVIRKTTIALFLVLYACIILVSLAYGDAQNQITRLQWEKDILQLQHDMAALRSKRSALPLSW